jgi:protocatechuate 3,4-dioxygenase beta subunit
MKALAILLAAASLHGQSVIRGMVVENLTGKPLARAVVILQPVGGTPGDQQSQRATSQGGFEFQSLAAGSYVVKASRKAFIAAEYGQKRWNSAGYPVVVKDGETAFLNLRLPRFSAISGTVVDENEIGLPEHEVAAYRLRNPPELVATAKANDRGEYRLHGLEPGAYAVRAVAKQYPDGSYLPTYARESEELRNAVRVDLLPEQEMAHVDVRPAPGQLFTVRVTTGNFPPWAEVTITMAGETGRKSAKAREYAFPGLAPGDYDFYAEGAGEEGIVAAYQRLHVTKDAVVSLLGSPGGGVSVYGVANTDSAKLWVRRKDMAGVGETKQWPLKRGRGSIPAGRWELLLEPPDGSYVSSFNDGTYRPFRLRGDGWNETIVDRFRGPGFQLASGPGSLRGTVKSSGDPVDGAPVYVEGWDTNAKARVGELRSIRTDVRGQFRLDGLAPGSYRVLASFEYLNPDEETMGVTAQEITVPAHAEKSLELELYVIR